MPLALDARVTSATWALEGAALVWVGVRQAHLRARVVGVVLQFAAAIAFALGFSLWTDRPVRLSLPVLNSDCLGALLVACAALATSRMLARSTGIRTGERALVPLVFGWGLLWWLGAGWHEIDRFVAPDMRTAVFVAFLAASAVLFASLAARFDWPLARVPAYALPAALLLIAIARVVDMAAPGGHLLAGGGEVAWPLALVAEVLLLWRFDRASDGRHALAIDAGHAIAVWLVTLIVADELGWFARMHIRGAVWPLVPWGVVPALMLTAVASLTARGSWPFGAHVRAYLRGGGVPLAAAALVWTLFANIRSSGDPAPLPFLPLVNPLDLTQALVIVGIASWLRRMRQDEPTVVSDLSPDALGAGVALLLFWVTCSTLRTLHQYADIPWSLASLWASRVTQSALSIVWSLFALAAMVVANRRRHRVAWVVGAALLGVVVAKLFVVDLAQVGGIERIVSFIGVGALLLVVGYVAPVPPRPETR